MWGICSVTVSLGHNWYLAQVKPNSIKIAERNLIRQGFETFAPMEETTSQKAGKFVTQLRALFPGYIFVGIDALRGQWRAVNSTYGVTKLVSFGAAPAPVPAGLVTDLRQRCDAAGKLQPPQALRVGDQVTVTKGPFARFVAEIDAIDPQQRVWILLDIMGGQTRVSIGLDQLQAS